METTSITQETMAAGLGWRLWRVGLTVWVWVREEPG